MTDPRSCCSVRGERSAWFSVGSGVPQGTVLGPILFLAYINYFPECIRSKIKLFANDAKMYRNIKEKETITSYRKIWTVTAIGMRNRYYSQVKRRVKSCM